MQNVFSNLEKIFGFKECDLILTHLNNTDDPELIEQHEQEFHPQPEEVDIATEDETFPDEYEQGQVKKGGPDQDGQDSEASNLFSSDEESLPSDKGNYSIISQRRVFILLELVF